MPDALPPPYGPFRAVVDILTALKEPPLADMLLGPRPVTAGELFPPVLTAALRYLGLVDKDGAALQTLRALGHCDDAGRRRIVGELLREHYSWALEISERGGTQADLTEAFVARGRSGHTARKACTFFQHAARFAGIALSPRFRSPRAAHQPRKRPLDAVGDQSVRRRSGRYERTVSLDSGGSVTLVIRGDLLSLLPADTSWITALMTQLDTYEESGPQPP